LSPATFDEESLKLNKDKATRLATTVIGSYPQPDWLVDKAILRSQRVPRVRQPELWRPDPDRLDEAIADATRLAVRDMVEAGIDIVTDGEIGRESYSNRLLCSLEGVEFENPAEIVDRRGRSLRVPRIVGKLSRRSATEIGSARFLKSIAPGKTKVTLPGPFTMAQQCTDEYYGDKEELAFALAKIVNSEARDIAAEGIDVVQLDEPWFRNDPDSARAYGVKLLDHAIKGVSAATAIHLCFGYGFLVAGTKPREYDFLSELADSQVDQISIEAAQPNLDLGVLKDIASKTIILGVLNLSTEEVEPVSLVVQRIKAALEFVTPENLMPAPDCGMKYLSRASAAGKLRTLGAAVAEIRARLN
jgi:5-methyltetrahydropteroyltriglutamate--homocysteine methyltransferase